MMKMHASLFRVSALIWLVFTPSVEAQMNPSQIVVIPSSPIASNTYVTVIVPARGCRVFGAYNNQAAIVGQPVVSITDATSTSAGVVDISIQEANVSCDVVGTSESAMFPVAVPVVHSFPQLPVVGLPAGEYTINYTTHQLSLDISVYDSSTGNGPPLPGLWAITSEVNGSPGRGFQLELHGNTMVLTFYGYEASGAGRFWLASGTFGNQQFSGTLTAYDGGKAFGGPSQSAHAVGNAGAVAVTFSSPTTGTITLPNESPKAISYFRF